MYPVSTEDLQRAEQWLTLPGGKKIIAGVSYCSMLDEFGDEMSETERTVEEEHPWPQRPPSVRLN
jgi:hypothetical protein